MENIDSTDTPRDLANTKPTNTQIAAKFGHGGIRHDKEDDVNALGDSAGKLGQAHRLVGDTDKQNMEQTNLTNNKDTRDNNVEDGALLNENNRFQNTDNFSSINEVSEGVSIEGKTDGRMTRDGSEDREADNECVELRQKNEKNSKGNIKKEVDKKANKDAYNGASDACNEKTGVDTVGGGTPDVRAPLSADLQAQVGHTWKVPDGGWGWVVVASALVISLIVDGLTYTFGVFLGDFEQAFHEPKSKISLASSIQVGLYLFIGPVVSALTNRFGCRPVIIAGSLISSAAFIISSWSTDVTMLILSYGVIGGIGFGLMYLPAIVAVSIYFEERRAFATGIAVCGSGIGTFILAPLTDYLIFEYNWSWTLFILGALILNGVVFGALVRPLELQRQVLDGSHLDQSDIDGRVFQGKAIQAYTSSARSHTQEEVPLISVKDDRPVVLSITSDTSKQDSSRTFFSSTPNMVINSTSQFGKVIFKDGNHKSSEESTFSPGNSASRTRSNTMDVLRGGQIKPTFTSDKPAANTPPRVRAHAPLGLAFISLSDANLNKIRGDVQLPLSRKDIHLSGPLPFPESDKMLPRDDKGQGLYVQSLKSMTSLSLKDGLEESRGVWSCLPVSARETLEQMLSLSILKDKRYWFVLMGNFFCMIGFYVPFVYVPDRAKQLGIEEDKAAFLLSIIGITNTVGRVLTGVIINFLNIDCLLVTTVALALAGIMTAVCPFCETYAGLAGVSAVFGICVAAYISLCSVLLCELLGVENLTNAFGFVILFRGVACIMGPPIAGAIFDATGVYDPSFYIGGSMIFLGAVCHALLMIPCCRRQKTTPILRD